MNLEVWATRGLFYKLIVVCVIFFVTFDYRDKQVNEIFSIPPLEFYSGNTEEALNHHKIT